MDTDERTYSKSEIRERRRELEQLVALQQRQLDALAKMDEAADELDQVEREMADLASGGTQPEQSSDTEPPEPQMTGERAVTIMREDYPDTWLAARRVLEGMDVRGWVAGKDPALVLQSLRHSLRRLALHNPNVERKTKGSTHYYRYRTSLDGDALTPVKANAVSASAVAVNGTARPALQGVLRDG
jgi:hypothetical protein